jgi:L-histidine Nalpha-methyltransferase
LTTATPVSPNEAVLNEALSGLTGTPKTLSPWLFYDERGSQLFEAITDLPEYYLTRTERALFATHADDILREFLTPGTPATQVFLPPDPFTIAELGAGSATKTGLLLQAATRLQPRILYQPIDVSASALEAAENLAATIPSLTVHPQVANYVTEPYTLQHPASSAHTNGHTNNGHTSNTDPARASSDLGAPSSTTVSSSSKVGSSSLRRDEPTPRSRVLALYIGSSIGNFSPDEAQTILGRLRSHLQPGDALLLGADLAPSAHKPISTILAAYDDAAGVTAAFNLNVLARLNRDLDADFNLDAFAHRARWNPAESRIEMHLESLIPQTVHIAGRRIPFAQGETIHTENSYKFTDAALTTLLTRSGFTPTRTFHDPTRSFALTLAHTL